MPRPFSSNARSPYAKNAGYRAGKLLQVGETMWCWVTVYNSAEAELDTEAGKWHVVCEQHGTTLATDLLADAKSAMWDSVSWCEECG